MLKKLTRVIGICLVVSCMSLPFISAFNSVYTITTLTNATKVLLENGINDDTVLSKFLNDINSGASIEEEGLIAICDRLLAYDFIFDGKTQLLIKDSKNNIIKWLKSFIASGAFFATGVHGGLIYGQRSSSVTVTYKNNTGQAKQREYKLSLETIGFKLSINYHFGAIFITGNGFNYYDTAKIIYLNQGIESSDAGLLGLDLLYCSVRTIPSCGIWILGGNLGIGGSLSYVFGGALTPA